jgi:hypothetical protein
METPEQAPEELSAKQAAEDLDAERGPLENEGDPDRDSAESDEAVPTPTNIDEELEDRGDV